MIRSVLFPFGFSTLFCVQIRMKRRFIMRKSILHWLAYSIVGLFYALGISGGVRYNHRNHRIPTPYYHCNRRERTCNVSSTNAEYLETYVYRLLTRCLFKKENSQKLITVNLQKLLGAYEPIHATVIEVRNHIGQPRQHDKQVFDFSALSVQI